MAFQMDSVTESVSPTNLSFFNKVSIDALTASLPANILLSLFGIQSSIVNVIIMIVIVKSKPIHTKCFFLLANLSVSDFLIGTSYVVTGLKRMAMAVMQIPETTSQLYCLGAMFIPFLSQITSINFAAAIAIDRLFAVSYPQKYQFVHTAYIATLVTSAWGFSLLIGGFYFYNASSTLILANCNLGGIMNATFYSYQSGQSLILAVCTTFAYLVVLVLMKLKLIKAKKHNNSVAEAKKLLDRATTVTLSAVVFAYCFTQVTSTVILAATANLPTSKKNVITPIVRILPVLNSGVNFWIYLWRSSEFRSGFRHLFGLKKLGVLTTSVFVLTHRATTNN